MTLTVKHNFVSAKADGTDPTMIQPSNWNDNHNIQMGAGTLLGNSSGVAGPAGEVPIATLTPNANMIINGDFLVDQRNNYVPVSVNNSNSGLYTMDRWMTYCRVTGTANQLTVQNYAAGSPVSRVCYVNVATAGLSTDPNDYIGVQYTIELCDLLAAMWGTPAAKPITISFWVNGSVAGTYGLGLRDNATTRYYIASYTINNANTWEFKTITIPGDVGGANWGTGSSAGNVPGVRLFFDLGCNTGTSDVASSTWVGGGAKFGLTGGVKIGRNNAGANWYIGQVKVELGSTATQFQSDGYAATLAKCQRYFQVFGQTGNSSSVVQMATGYMNTGWQAIIPLPLYPSMRTTPSVRLPDSYGYYAIQNYQGSQGSTALSMSYNASSGSPNLIQLVFNQPGGNTPFPTNIPVNFNAAVGVARVFADAEL